MTALKKLFAFSAAWVILALPAMANDDLMANEEDIWDDVEFTDDWDDSAWNDDMAFEDDAAFEDNTMAEAIEADSTSSMADATPMPADDTNSPVLIAEDSDDMWGDDDMWDDDMGFEEEDISPDYFGDDDLGDGVTQDEGRRDTDTFSIDYEEAEIRTVVRNIADLYNLNVVIPDNLTGFVSLKLRNVTWPDVMEAILDPVGFAYVDDGNIIKIKSIDEIQTEPMDTELFSLRFSSAGDVMGSVRALVDTEFGGRVIADERTNTLMVTERPTRLRQLAKVIDRLDRAESQIMIETKLVEVVNVDSFRKGIDWSSTLGGDGYTGKIGNDAGVSGASPGITRTFIPKDSLQTRAAGGIFNDTFIFNLQQFSVALKALEDDSENRILASPNIVTMNNTQADIHITTRRPVPNYAFNEQTGTFQVDGFEFIDIGVNLEVTPKAQEDLITLDIRPEVSDATGSVTFNSGGGTSAGTTEIPIVQSRRSHSIVTLKSGYTVALAGMRRTVVDNDYNAIPVIGSLPVVGNFFSSKNKSKTKTDLIVFVTATQIGFDGSHLYPSDGGNVRNADPRLIRDVDMTPDQIPGYNPTEEEKRIIERWQDVTGQLNADAYTDKVREQVQAILAEEHIENRFHKKQDRLHGPGAQICLVAI